MTKVPILLRIQLLLQFVGAAVILAYCLGVGVHAFMDQWFLVVMFAIGVAAAWRFPFTVFRSGSLTEFTADVMILVASSLLLPTRVGTITLLAGALVGLVIEKEMTALLGLYNLCLMVLSTYLALSLGHLIGGPGSLGPRSIAGALVAAFIYDESSAILAAAKPMALGQVKFWPFFRATLSTTVFTWPWLVAIGIILGALGLYTPWVLPLTAAPLALVFLASRDKVKATEGQTRLDYLLAATSSVLEATSIIAVIDAATTAATNLFQGKTARIDTEEPGQEELGVPLYSEHFGQQHLIVGTRSVMLAHYTDQDRRLLETLASITASALDKAAIHHDATERANRDVLTGLANRRSFEEQVQMTLEGIRASDGNGVGIVFIDLDGFKQINDEHGHQAGDQVLVEASKRISRAVRSGDIVARLGGDEFTILLRGVLNKDEAAVVAERVLASMRNPVLLGNGAQVICTPSIGVALAVGRDTDSQKLLQYADEAMYRAKSAGKDCWRLAEDEPALLKGIGKLSA